MPAQEEPAHFYGSMQADKLIRILCAKIIIARGRMKLSPMDEAGYKTTTYFDHQFCQDRVPGSVRDSCAGVRDRLGENYGNRSRIRLTPSNQPVLGGSII